MNTLLHKMVGLTLMLLLAGTAWAQGDEHAGHSHAAPASVNQTASAVPTLRTETDLFELVARLYPDELGVYIDHWATNAPLLNAELEVEFNGHKAKAVFHADHGDYAVADASFLKALHAAGEHALVFTIVADKDADLLTGTLRVEHEGALAVLVGKRWWWVGVLVLAAMLLSGGLVYWLRQRKGGSV